MKHDVLSIRSPARPAVVGGVVREVHRLATRAADDVDVVVAGAVGREDDVPAICGNVWIHVRGRVVRDSQRPAAVPVHDVDFVVAVAGAEERDAAGDTASLPGDELKSALRTTAITANPNALPLMTSPPGA